MNKLIIIAFALMVVMSITADAQSTTRRPATSPAMGAARPAAGGARPTGRPAGGRPSGGARSANGTARAAPRHTN